SLFGHARPAGVGPNPARQIAVRAGVPVTSPAATINMACGSGLRAILMAAQSIATGERQVVLAGGVEAMSRVPYLLEEVRFGHKMGHQRVTDAMVRDGFLCPLCHQVMGETAETLADRYGIGREEQDRFAAESQNRCERAPRDGVTAESLASLPPVFRKGGTVHAGNSSGIVDGASACVVMSEEAARRLGVKPMARLTASALAGVPP